MRSNEKTSRLRALALLALTLFAGFSAGVLADRLLLVRQQRILPKEGMTFASARVVRQMTRELNLSNEQAAEVREILERRQKRIESQWAELRPRVRVEVAEAEMEMRGILRPDQIAGFDELREKWRRRARLLTGRDASEK